jgi:rhomboid protease GluP
VLLGAITLVFVAQLVLLQQNAPAPEPITPWGAMIFDRILNYDEYYRLFTSMFIHLSETHFFSNALALYFVGRAVETYFGRGRMAIIYFLGGISGSLASFMFSRGASAGASGAIFALIGAELAFLWLNRQLLGLQGRVWFQQTLMIAGLNLFIGFVSAAVPAAVRIDNWGHIGGLFAGLVLAWFIAPQYEIRAEQKGTEQFKVVDRTSMIARWRVPAIYMAGMLAALIYSVINLR